jgi:MYXO-CTERM domain-containing protein
MKHVRGDCVVLAVALLASCGDLEQPSTESIEHAATVCGSGSTVKGVDVSYYQDDIDWAAAKADGVEYAFVRVSDGLNTPDTKFDQNWQGTKAAGVLRGVYQYFRPNQDAIAQADLLLTRMGALEANDLPPVIDVETMGGLSAAEVKAQMRLWIDHVQAATGVTPILYTGFYFWRDQVGAPSEFGVSPLWHAQYTTAECPNIPAPWQDWAFWQFTDSGSVDGIPGGVDTNRFNGTREQLLALTVQPTECSALSPDGGTIDDGDACFSGGGPGQFLRRPSDAGHDGDLVWTHTTDKAEEVNFGHWSLITAEAGRYRIEVSTPAAYAESKQALYRIRAAGTEHEIVIDQTAADGFQSLGEFELAAGGDQYIHVGDNTGEPGADNVQLVFDAVRITRIGEDFEGPPDGEEPPADGGCQAGGGAGLLAALGLLGLLRRRRN